MQPPKIHTGSRDNFHKIFAVSFLIIRAQSRGNNLIRLSLIGLFKPTHITLHFFVNKDTKSQKSIQI